MEVYMKQALLTGAALLLSASVAALAQPAPSTTTGSGMNRNVAVNPAHSGSTAMDSGAMFTSVPPQEELSSKVVGLEVYNSANQDVGKIKDIAYDQSGVKAYIVAVGGFLGMGDHYVAVQPSAVQLSWDANAKKWHAAMNTDANQLKAAPEYKYSSNE
jgi:PRC-barrel domain